MTSARSLAASLLLNKADAYFASDKKNEIFYILDTNVIESYLSEGSNANSGEFSFGDLLRDETAARVSDRLALEFLLSGRLAGQRTPAVYLSASHWNETLRRADKIATKIRGIVTKTNPQRPAPAPADS